MSPRQDRSPEEAQSFLDGLKGGCQETNAGHLAPNEETVEAMRAARRGELVTAGTVDELLRDLHEED